MKVIYGDKVAYLDVDDTLVIWKHTAEKLGLGLNFRRDAIMVGVSGNDGIQMPVLPNTAVFDFIEGLKAQGTVVVVWSHGGARWAEAVVQALGLNAYVDYVISKPTFMLDDKSIEHLGNTRCLIIQHLQLKLS